MRRAIMKIEIGIKKNIDDLPKIKIELIPIFNQLLLENVNKETKIISKQINKEIIFLDLLFFSKQRDNENGKTKLNQAPA